MKKLFAQVKGGVAAALKQGWSKRKIAWSIAWGSTIGIFPIYGVTTVCCLAVGHVARLNHAIMQSCNYLIAPLKLALIFPFLRLGEWVFMVEAPLSLSLEELFAAFRSDPIKMLADFSLSFLHAITGWLLVMPCVAFGLRIFAGWLLREQADLSREAELA